MEAILSVDAGSTALKVVAFDVHLTRLARVTRELVLDHPRQGWVEFDADLYWRNVCDAIQELLRLLSDDCHIVALSVSSHTDTLIAIDRNGQVLRPGIFWYDNRAARYVEEVSEKFGKERFFHVTGQTGPSAIMQALKIRWLLDNESERASKTGHFFQTADYLIYRLTGQAVLDVSIACSSGLVDFQNRQYWQEMLDYVGVNRERLPTLVEPGTRIGSITALAARETGLPLNTPVVAGAMDQTAATLAAGNIRAGIVTESTGAALALCATVDSPVFDPRCAIPCFCHALPDKYILLPWCETGGMVLRWFRDGFYADLPEAKTGSDLYDLMTREAAAVAPGSDGLIMLPYLAGGGPPDYNPHARGVFYGITLAHGRAHFVRSLMEAVAYMVRENVELVESLGIKVCEIRSLGGGAKSPLWCQIKADVLNRPLLSMGEQEMTSLGVAILAGVGVGLFDSIEQALNFTAHNPHQYAPDASNRLVYEDSYSVFKRLQRHLTPLFAPSQGDSL